MIRLFGYVLFVLAAPSIACGLTVSPAETIPPETVSSVAGLSPAIAEGDLRSEVQFLASDDCAGRLTGSDGALRAAQYVATAFSQAGLQHPPGEDH